MAISSAQAEAGRHGQTAEIWAELFVERSLFSLTKRQRYGKVSTLLVQLAGYVPGGVSISRGAAPVVTLNGLHPVDGGATGGKIPACESEPPDTKRRPCSQAHSVRRRDGRDHRGVEASRGAELCAARETAAAHLANSS